MLANSLVAAPRYSPAGLAPTGRFPNRALGALIVSLLLAACNDMRNQPRYDPLAAAPGWPHDQSALVPPEGTVARDDAIGPAPQTLPEPLSRELLARGGERFDIFCSPCHGGAGYGDGMIVQRGFPAPPSLHSARLRDAPLRHFYDVISDGFGTMYAYGARVPPSERWAIAAYIRALQLSQNATLDDLTPQQRRDLEQGKPERAKQQPDNSGDRP